MKKFLLDANNIIHKIPEAKTTVKDDFPRAAAVFLNLLKNYADAYSAYTFVAVFDGPVGDILFPADNIRLIGAAKGQTADEIIKDLAEKEMNKKLCIVISSDAEVYRHAKMNGCKAAGSEEFIREMRNSQSFSEMYGEKPSGMPKDEMDNLKKAFGVKIKMEEKKSKSLKNLEKLKEALESGKTKKSGPAPEGSEKPDTISKKEIEEYKKMFGI